jgi:hypothetical protein
LLGGCCHFCLLWQACLFTVCLSDYPSLVLWGSGTPPTLLHVFLFIFFQLLVYYSVCFFPFFPAGWGSVCLGGYADLAQDCL